MRKKLRILFACLVILVLGAIAWLIFGGYGPEPEYKGKPLSYWLWGYDQGNYKLDYPDGPPPPSDQEADEAVRAMGTNVTEMLVRMLRHDDSKIKVLAWRVLHKQHFIKVRYPILNANHKAFNAFKALGETGSNAVPQLITLFETDHSSSPQQMVPMVLSYVGPVAAPAVPALLHGLSHTNEIVRYNIIGALGSIHAEPTTVVPALTTFLKNTNSHLRAQAATALGNFGKEAASAIPALLQLATNPPPRPTPTAGKSWIMSSGKGGWWFASWADLPTYPFSDEPDAVKKALMKIDPNAARNAGVK